MGRRWWDKQEVILVDDLLSRGYSYKEIASVLGRSYESVRGMVKRMRRSRNKGRGENLGGKRHRGLLDLSFEEVLVLLGNRDRGNLEGGHMKLIKKSQEKDKDLDSPHRIGYTMSDYEVTKIVERYLKRTGNIEGARNLWNLHLEYKRRRENENYARF
jgi:transposase